MALIEILPEKNLFVHVLPSDFCQGKKVKRGKRRKTSDVIVHFKTFDTFLNPSIPFILMSRSSEKTF
jgi:hypothetical protein